MILYIILKYSLKKGYFNREGLYEKISGSVKLRFILEDLGGVFLKFGQILAMRFDLLPTSYCLELMNLFDKITPVSPQSVFLVFQNEFNASPESVFGKFNETPIAVASFGQVYEAWTKNNERVAVKIQKPNIEKYFNIDIFLLKIFAFCGDMLKILKSITFREIVNQFQKWTEAEFNYEIEANNTEIIYEHAKEHPNIHVPRVYREYSTRRVLTQEFLDGEIIHRILTELVINDSVTLERLKTADIDPLKTANAFLVDAMRQYFVDGFFHADPHPANLMVFRGGDIGFIDFGIIGKPQSSRFWLLEFIRGASERNYEMASAGLLKFGFKWYDEHIDVLIEADTEFFNIYQRIYDIMRRSFAKELEKIINSWWEASRDSSLALYERSSAVTFLRIVMIADKYGVKFPQDIVTFIRALVIIDMVCLKLDKRFNMVEAILLFFSKYPFNESQKEFTHTDEIKEELLIGVGEGRKLSLEFLTHKEILQKEKALIVKEKFMEHLALLAERNIELRKFLLNEKIKI